MRTPTIHRLVIDRFRGIKELSWRPAAGVNVILGGGNVGKSTILDALALLLSPTAYTTLSDTDYYRREIDSEFSVEAVYSLPPECGINDQFKTCWPWEWTGSEAVVPATDAEVGTTGHPVYRLRVRGSADLELAYEIIQPDGKTDSLPVALRRRIGLIRLGGDDRNDRDLRLVQGSALDRLLSDKGLRSRMATELAGSKVSDRLSDNAKTALNSLDHVFQKHSLPRNLDIAVTGSQGFSIAALIGLTAQRDDVPLPLTSWGAGTRRLAALTVAAQNQGDAPITLVDEIERGLEPYRQRFLVKVLQATTSQVFVTTHSPFVISAASRAALWYIDHEGQIGRLESPEIDRQRESDPETFLSRLTVVVEGKTEQGFVAALLEKAFGSSLEQHGVHVCNGGGHESSLNLLEALAVGGLRFACFADDEGKHLTRWQRLTRSLNDLLFRWSSGCIEDNVISTVKDEQLLTFLTDPKGEKTGTRLRTLALRLRIDEGAKDFETIRRVAGPDLRGVILQAAKGSAPEGAVVETKQYRSHGREWFKTVEGGRELAGKLFSLGLWPSLRSQLLPFCNGVRKAVDLSEIQDIDQ